jgi:hypothetical protein
LAVPAQCRRPFLSALTLKPVGNSGRLSGVADEAWSTCSPAAASADAFPWTLWVGLANPAAAIAAWAGHQRYPIIAVFVLFQSKPAHFD